MSELEYVIREVVERIGDPLMDHIYSNVTKSHEGRWTFDEIRGCVVDMVNRGILRMKEDCVDHDWSYRRGRNW